MEFIFNRSAGARITDKLSYKDLRIVVMENDALCVVVTPEKGADIVSFVDKKTGVDVMARLANGLRSPKSELPLINQPHVFFPYYEGGWQEIFPTASAFGEYKGKDQPFHGETPQLSWDWRILEDTVARVTVEFRVRTILTPFELVRRMRLDARSPEVIFEESIENLSTMDLPYMWGHHPAFGAPFLSGDCRIELPKCRLFEGDETIKKISPPNKPRAVMAYALDIARGIYGIRNEKLGFGFGMKWDKRVFPKIWIWQSLHVDAKSPHFKREYACAIEPFTSIPHQWYGKDDPLPVLKSRQKLKTKLSAFLYRGKLPK